MTLPPPSSDGTARQEHTTQKKPAAIGVTRVHRVLAVARVQDLAPTHVF
jgi:hypothetical protein